MFFYLSTYVTCNIFIKNKYTFCSPSHIHTCFDRDLIPETDVCFCIGMRKFTYYRPVEVVVQVCGTDTLVKCIPDK